MASAIKKRGMQSMCGQHSSEKSFLTETAELVLDQQPWHLLRTNVGHGFFTFSSWMRIIRKFAMTSIQNSSDHPCQKHLIQANV